jgi:hypothetical protein
MSNGTPDLPAANAQCEAYMRDIRESRAEDRSAKGHFQLAKEQFQDAKLALESGDVNDAVRHTLGGVNEGLRAAGAQVQADTHKTAAWNELAGYHDKMGHDPEHATPGSCMTVEATANPAGGLFSPETTKLLEALPKI